MRRRARNVQRIGAEIILVANKIPESTILKSVEEKGSLSWKIALLSFELQVEGYFEDKDV